MTAAAVPAPASSPRRGDWGLTFSGRQFWPADPRPGDVCIEDIAHALAMQCRFAGHCRAFYSTAQHSVLVSETCNAEHALIGLLHDATEAYLQDLIRPLKRELRPLYKPLEEAWALVIGTAFGLGSALVDLPRDVHVADRIVLVTERRDLLAPRDWPEEASLALKIDPVGPAYAEAMFLARWRELTGGAR